MSEIRTSSIKNLAGEPLITKESLGLELVDNVPDLQKPVSVPVQNALAALSTVPDGGTVRQALQKGSNLDGDFVWADSTRVVNLYGTTPNETPVSLGGGIAIPPSSSAFANVKVAARAANGLSKAFQVKATLRNNAVVGSESTYTYGDSGTGSWSITLAWNAGLGYYTLTVVGASDQITTWNASVELVVAE